ncbi:hypothetical protein [Prosthecomicrobium sp. N25]|uniref:hypothetical protein n=1 Tax=Prosthecomicrobium sp. N25 TaxID=3129254 RepID=UPI0030781287
MSLKSTMLAIAAAATLATGMTAATTSSAEAGYFVKVKHGHHGFHGHFYRPRFYYPAYHSCFWKPRQIWTYHGPAWVSKRVCY